MEELEEPIVWPIEEKSRQISDIVHEQITLYYPLNVIVDTPHFQRLRSLKQLGVANLVYPCADHSRFSHCLGTYWLAWNLLKKLKEKYPSLNITSAEHLCISIAALVHDIGHGPFSHFFDGPFRQAIGGTWKHEELSIRIFDSICALPEVNAALREFLGSGDELERNLRFIKELISPVPSPTGRGRDRAFLYDIVSNQNDSFDVDKFDYLIRDSVITKVSVQFDKTNLLRLFENVKVLPDPNTQIPRLTYASKVHQVLLSIGESRQTLHDLVYQHKTVIVLENLLVKAIVSASEHLKFYGNEGKIYNLREVTNDMAAYMKTSDDGILNQIINSTSPELEEARNLINNIQSRKIPKNIYEYQYSTGDINLDTIMQELRARLPEDVTNEITLLSRNMNKGLGATDPIARVLLYDNNNHEVNCPELTKLQTPGVTTINSVMIYISRSKWDRRNEVIEAFRNIVSETTTFKKNRS